MAHVCIKSALSLIGIFNFVSGSPVFAEGLSTYSIQPMQAVIKLENQSSQNFTLTNHSQETVTVALEGYERIDKNGIERRVSTTEIAFDKTRLQIAPGQTASVSVEYRGRKNLDVERSFRVVTKQLSSARPQGGFRFSYETSLFVARDKMVPDMRAEISSKPVTGGLEVELENRGTAHQALSEISFFLLAESNSGSEKPLELDSATKEKLAKQILLPRSKRRVKLQLASAETLISLSSSIVVRSIR